MELQDGNSAPKGSTKYSDSDVLYYNKLTSELPDLKIAPVKNADEIDDNNFNFLQYKKAKSNFADMPDVALPTDITPEHMAVVAKASSISYFNSLFDNAKDDKDVKKRGLKKLTYTDVINPNDESYLEQKNADTIRENATKLGKSVGIDYMEAIPTAGTQQKNPLAYTNYGQLNQINDRLTEKANNKNLANVNSKIKKINASLPKEERMQELTSFKEYQSQAPIIKEKAKRADLLNTKNSNDIFLKGVNEEAKKNGIRQFVDIADYKKNYEIETLKNINKDAKKNGTREYTSLEDYNKNFEKETLKSINDKAKKNGTREYTSLEEYNKSVSVKIAPKKIVYSREEQKEQIAKAGKASGTIPNWVSTEDAVKMLSKYEGNFTPAQVAGVAQTARTFNENIVKKEAAKKLTKPVPSLSESLQSGFASVNPINIKAPIPPTQTIAPKRVYSEEDENMAFLESGRLSGVIPKGLSNKDALKLIAEKRLQIDPKTKDIISEAVVTSKEKRKEIANASHEEILNNSAFRTQELLSADALTQNLYKQSREGKAADIINRIQSGLQGEVGNETVSEAEWKYLKEVAPKAAESLWKEINPNNSNNLNDVIAIYKDKDKAYKVTSANSRASAINAAIPQDWLDADGQISEANLLEKHKEFNDNYAQSLIALEEKYPMQYAMIRTADGMQNRPIGRGYEYAAEKRELEDKRAQVNNIIAEANGIMFVRQVDKTTGRQKNALLSPDVIGEKIFKLQSPDLYKVYIKGGKTDRGTQEEIKRLGINALYASNDKNAIELAYADERKLNETSLDLEKETYNRIGAEIYKGGNWWKYLGTYRRSVEEIDEIVKQLPYPNRKMWFDKLRAIEEQQTFGTNIPMGGALTSAVYGFGKTAYSTLNTLSGAVGFRTDKDIANDALAGQDNKYSVVGETKEAQKTKSQLEYKLSNKEQLTYSELQNLENAINLLGTKTFTSKFTDKGFELVGQVVFQGVVARGLGGLTAGALGEIGLLSEAGLISEEAAIAAGSGEFGTAMSGATTIGEIGVSKTTLDTLANAYVAYASSLDQAKQEAVLLMPDSKVKQEIYANVVGLLNAATAHIFPEQKLFDPFKKEISATITNIVNDLSASKLSKEALSGYIKKALLASKSFGIAVVKNNQKESAEEVAGQIGTSIALAILAPNKFNNKEEFDKVLDTYYQASVDGSVLSLFAGGKEYFSNIVGIPLLSKVGTDENVYNKVIQGINSQVSNKEISEAEGEEKRYIANTIRYIYKKSIPKVAELSPNLKERDIQKYAIVLANEYVVRKKIDTESDPVIKAKLEAKVKDSEAKREAIIDEKLTTVNNYELVTIEEANKIAKAEADNGQIVTTNADGTVTTTPIKTIDGVGTYEFDNKLYVQDKDGNITYENGVMAPIAEQEKVKKEGLFTPQTATTKIAAINEELATLTIGANETKEEIDAKNARKVELQSELKTLEQEVATDAIAKKAAKNGTTVEFEVKKAEIEKRRKEELSTSDGKKQVGLNFSNGKYQISTFDGEEDSFSQDVELTKEEKNELSKIDADSKADGDSPSIVARKAELAEKIINRLGIDGVTATSPNIINAKYDKELAVLETSVNPASIAALKEVEVLRTEEQKELDSKIPNADQYRVDGKVDRTKLTNDADIKAFDEVYAKYDKLITPLLEKEKAGSVDVVGDVDNITVSTKDKVFNKEEFVRDIDKLEKEKANGSRNIGLYSFKNKFVKVVKSKRNVSKEDVNRLRERVSDMDNVYPALEIIDLPNGSQAIVMDKASGKIGNELTQKEIDNIPQEHWDKFEQTIRELSKRGVQTDLTKRSNVLYDKDKGFQFIDLEGASIEGDSTNKFFKKDGKEYYYNFEKYTFFPKEYKSAKEIFTNIKQAAVEQFHKEVLKTRTVFGNLPVGIKASEGAPTSKVHAPLFTAAKTALKVLNKLFPNTEIHFHENNSDFQKVLDATANGKEASKTDGNFAYVKDSNGKYTVRIDINLANPKASVTTVIHEAGHPILLSAFGENPDYFKYLKSQVAKSVGFTKNAKLKEFIKAYDDAEQPEEYLVQLGGILKEGEKIEPNVFRRIAEAINKIFLKITDGKFKPFENVKNSNDAVRYFASLVDAIRNGDLGDIKLSSQSQKSGATEMGSKQSRGGLTATDMKSMTVADNGDLLFFHYGDIKGSKIDARKGTPKAYTTDKRVYTANYYYTNESDREGMVGGKVNVVRVPADKVYSFNKDVLGLFDEAKKNSEAHSKGQAFSPNRQADFIAQLAAKNGFDMVVAKWGNGYRAESPKALTIDAALTKQMRTNGSLSTAAVDEKLNQDIYNAAASKANGNSEKYRSAFYGIKDITAKDIMEHPILSRGIPKKLADKYNAGEIKSKQSRSNEDNLISTNIFIGRDNSISEISDSYKRKNNLSINTPNMTFAVSDKDGKRIADAYDQMKHSPNDPSVKKGFADLITQIKSQADALMSKGYKFQIANEGEGYNSNSKAMVDDVRKTKRIFIDPSSKSFGTDRTFDKENIGLQDSGYKDANGIPMTNVELIRGVHDLFGHNEFGNGFGATGEENAWRNHMSMFTGLAQKALTATTRGQNSWVNFAKHMRNSDGSIKKKGDKGYLSANERPFAEQKIGFLPDWATENSYGDVVTIEGKSVKPVNKYVVEGSEVYEIDDASAFYTAMKNAKESDTLAGIQVELKPVEKIQEIIDKGGRLLITKDGKVGMMVYADGNAGGGFKNTSAEGKNLLKPLLLTSIKLGARYADAYDTFLPEYYSKFGFKPYKRIKFNPEYAEAGWENTILKSKPDIVVLYWDGGSRENIGKNYGKFPEYNKSDGEYTDDYEGAIKEARNISIAKEPTASLIPSKEVIKSKQSKISSTEATKLNDQINLNINNINSGKQTNKEAIKNILDLITGLLNDNKISEKSANSLKKRFKNINAAYKNSVDRLLEYANKIFKDGKYADKISEIKSLNRAFKKAAKNDKIPVKTRQLASLFAKINPESLSDINAHLDMAKDIEKAIKQSKRENAEVKLRTPIKLDNASKYVEAATKEAKDYEAKNPPLIKVVNSFNDEEKALQYISDKYKEFQDAIKNIISNVVLTDAEMAQLKNFLKLSIDDFETIEEKTEAVEALEHFVANEDMGKIPFLLNNQQVKSNINKGVKVILPKLKSVSLMWFSEQKAKIRGWVYNKFLYGNTIDYNKELAYFMNQSIRRIDNLIGNLKTYEVFDNTFKAMASGYSKYIFKIKSMDADVIFQKVLASFNGDMDEAVKHCYKMTMYKLQLEYESNIGNIEVIPAIKHLNETLKSGNLTEKDKANLEELIKDFSTIDATTGEQNIDTNKIWDSFNEVEQQAAVSLAEHYAKLTPYAYHVAVSLRNVPFNPRANYMMLNVVSAGQPLSTLPPSASQVLTGRGSTEAQTINPRDGNPHPISLDPYNTFNTANRDIMMDYCLLNPIKTVEAIFEKLVKDTAGDKKANDAAKSLKLIFDEITQSVINRSIVNSDKITDGIISYIKKIGARYMLSRPSKAVGEFSGNLSYAITRYGENIIEGMKNNSLQRNFKLTTVMEVLNSYSLDRLYPHKGESGAFLDPNNFDIDVRDKKHFIDGFSNVAQVAYYNSLLKAQKAGESISDALMSVPDLSVGRFAWEGTFRLTFKKEAGLDIDMDKIAAKDYDYLEKYKDALEKATTEADRVVAEIANTKNPFVGIAKEAAWRGKMSEILIINNYMTSFTKTENQNGIDAAYAVAYGGKVSRIEGIRTIAAILVRSGVYNVVKYKAQLGLLAIGYGLLNAVKGGDDSEEKRRRRAKAMVDYLTVENPKIQGSITGIKDDVNMGNALMTSDSKFIESAKKDAAPEESASHSFMKGMAQAGAGIILGRSSGGFYNSLVTAPLVEYVNEKYIHPAISSEPYNKYRDGIMYSKVYDPNRPDPELNFIVDNSGAFQPFMKASITAVRTFYDRYGGELAKVEKKIEDHERGVLMSREDASRAKYDELVKRRDALKEKEKSMKSMTLKNIIVGIGTATSILPAGKDIDFVADRILKNEKFPNDWNEIVEKFKESRNYDEGTMQRRNRNYKDMVLPEVFQKHVSQGYPIPAKKP